MLGLYGYWTLTREGTSMAKTKSSPSDVATAPQTIAQESFELTPEELEAIKALRAKKVTGTAQGVTYNDMAALINAIQASQPKSKVHAYQRKKVCRSCGKEHKNNIPLKRVWYQHGAFELTKETFCNDVIELLNQVRPGAYCKGLVRVVRRKDRAYDITWPVATIAQRLRVTNEAGDTFEKILRRCIAEYNDPSKFKGPDDGDDD